MGTTVATSKDGTPGIGIAVCDQEKDAYKRSTDMPDLSSSKRSRHSS